MKKIKNMVIFFLAFFLFQFSMICSNAYAIASFAPPSFPLMNAEQASPITSAMNTYMQIQEIDHERQQQAMMEQRAAEERQAQAKILVFSNTKHQFFLGCINCASYEIDSIFNRSSPFWKKTYSSRFSNFSACNPHALHPPILFSQGITYGFLTLNTSLPGAVTKPELLTWLNTQLCHNKFEEKLRGVKK